MSFFRRIYNSDGFAVPRGSFTLNRGSQQAQGLVAWWPIAHSTVRGINELTAIKDYSLHNFQDLVSNSFLGGSLNPYGGYAAKYSTTDHSLNSGSVDASARIGAGTNDFSIFAWGTTTDSTRRVIFSTRNNTTDGYRFYKFNGSTLELQMDDGTASSVNSATDLIIDDGLPHLWGVTANRAANATFYEDGIVHGTADITTRNGSLIDASAGNNAIYVGKNSDNTTQTWDNGGGGLLWDIRVYDRVVPRAVAAAMYAPETRWDLYWQPKIMVMASEVAAAGAANPKGPFGMPLHGPFGGPI